MKGKTLIWLALASPCILVVGFLVKLVAGQSLEANIVPAPVQVSMRDSHFSLRPATRVLADEGARPAAELLVRRLNQATGYSLKVEPLANEQLGAIVLSAAASHLTNRGPEAYALEVQPNSVTVRANQFAGAFYGAQTLLQLMSPSVYATGRPAGPEGWPIQCAAVQDEPRFQWRGFLLDVARHFFTVAEVQKFVDSLALHKLNRLQLHLTDDQGWRLEIKKYPRLTEVGAWRKHIGFNLDPKSSTAYGPDGRYGGFYTREQVGQLVAYASARNITVVPEIEMPGHASGALTAYPEYSCFGGPYNTDMDGGVFAGVFCPGNDATFTFLEGVLSEVMEMFPGKYIHIGGDEVPKDNWKKCSKCQARIKAEGLKNEEELQSYFIRRIEKFITAKGRVLVGWSEIREGGLAPNTLLMDWIGGAAEAAAEGHDVIMTPTKYAYLDYYQSTNRAAEPRGIGGFLPLGQVYSFEPIPEKLAPEFQHHILGAQGNLWTEYIANLSHAEYMAYPRLTALAEVSWSRPAARSYADFQRRLRTHLQRLEAMGVNYRPPGKP